MTDVHVIKRADRIVSVECSGHTGYGEYGEDIVCAALSSVVQTALLGLLQVAAVNVKYTRNDAKGYLKAELPDRLSEKQQLQSSAILDTMLIGIDDLYQQYSDFINLEVIEDVY